MGEKHRMPDEVKEEERRGPPDVTLIPFIQKDQVLLYDIYLGTRWIGSRRTISACALFLGMPDLADNFRKCDL